LGQRLSLSDSQTRVSELKFGASVNCRIATRRKLGAFSGRVAQIQKYDKDCEDGNEPFENSSNLQVLSRCGWSEDRHSRDQGDKTPCRINPEFLLGQRPILIVRSRWVLRIG